jgi:perosamine synthetase
MSYIYQMEPGFDEDDAQAVADCVRSTWLLEGPRTMAFEQELSKFIGVQYATAVPSCTVGLAVSLMALGIGQDDEVIVPDMTFAATANAINLTGATPVFADIQLETLGLDPQALEDAITQRTKAIMPVWFNGRDPGIEQIKLIAQSNDLFIVEDAACALGSKVNGQHSGVFGNLGCFSFNTTKIITTGTGGLIVTNDPNMHERVRRLKNHGRLDRRDYHPMIGFNFGFSDLLAALGLAQLKKLEQRVAWKQRICELYRSLLADVPGIEILPQTMETILWYPDIFLDDPAGLKDFLQARGIQTRLYFPPVHSQPCYQASGEFPNAAAISARGIWLPISFSMTDSDVEKVCQGISAYLL